MALVALLPLASAPVPTAVAAPKPAPRCGWIVTNGSSYGYGCACISGAFDARRKRVTRIDSVRQKPISVCRADRKLKRPG